MSQGQRAAASGPTLRGDAATRPLLTLDRVRIGYRVGRELVTAVDEASFALFDGERVVLIGPSGCGKSSVLKAVGGFLEPLAGQIWLGGEHVRRPGPDRTVVFQEFDQLFPWRTVRSNVVYPLRVNGVAAEVANERADHFLELTRLADAADRYPHQLSGGMKQRVAIARALALRPRLLLMDEPFGALDAQTRSHLQTELLEIAGHTGVAIVFVTHDITEAVLLGHRVLVLNGKPSSVRRELDVSRLEEPSSPGFAAAELELRSLLATDAVGAGAE